MGKLQTTFTLYSWLWKFIGAVLLVVFALVLIFVEMRPLVESFMGLLIGGYAVMRLVPFIKTQKSDLIKTINIIEIVLNFLIAVVIIGYTISQWKDMGMIFTYLVAGVMIVRGMVHFYGVSEGHEKGDHPTYFFHIAILILAPLFIALEWDSTTLVWLMLFLSLVSGGYFAVGGYKGYSLYRKHKQMEQPKAKEKIADIDVPRKEDPVTEEEQIVN